LIAYFVLTSLNQRWVIQ